MRLRREQEEKDLKRKEKAEAHLYTIIKVTTLLINSLLFLPSLLNDS